MPTPSLVSLGKAEPDVQVQQQLPPAPPRASRHVHTGKPRLLADRVRQPGELQPTAAPAGFALHTTTRFLFTQQHPIRLLTLQARRWFFPQVLLAFLEVGERACLLPPPSNLLLYVYTASNATEKFTFSVTLFLLLGNWISP